MRIVSSFILFACLIGMAKASLEGQVDTNLQLQCSLYKPESYGSYTRCDPMGYEDMQNRITLYQAIESCLCYYLQHSLIWASMVPVSVMSLLSDYPVYELSGSKWKIFGETINSKAASESAKKIGDSLKSRDDWGVVKRDCAQFSDLANREIEKLQRVYPNNRLDLVLAANNNNFQNFLNGYIICKSFY